jgi:hypothetical protein
MLTTVAILLFLDFKQPNRSNDAHTQADVRSREILLVLAYHKVYLWVGKQVNAEERAVARSLAKQYLEAHGIGGVVSGTIHTMHRAQRLDLPIFPPRSYQFLHSDVCLMVLAEEEEGMEGLAIQSILRIHDLPATFTDPYTAHYTPIPHTRSLCMPR